VILFSRFYLSNDDLSRNYRTGVVVYIYIYIYVKKGRFAYAAKTGMGKATARPRRDGMKNPASGQGGRGKRGKRSDAFTGSKGLDGVTNRRR